MSPEADPRPPGPGAGLRVRDLIATGAGGLVLGPVSFDVAPGTLTCVVGPAASGKSLLLGALVGLVPAVGFDELRLDERSVGASSFHELRGQVGFAFQRDALLDHQTALENVLLALGGPGDDDARGRSMSALAAVGLAGAEHKRPPEMSGGMRRRVGLARALVRRPALLLLDDVTAGLDPSTAAEVLERVLSLARARPAAVVLATADVDIALPFADQVMLLEAGRVAYQGPPGGLPSKGPLAAFAPRSPRTGPQHEGGAAC